MIFIPSCDSREDAINSLAEIYAVSVEEITRVLEAEEPREIAQTYYGTMKQEFHFVVWYLLKAYPRDDIPHACYYHSTSYGGCPSWFDEGLLGSLHGVGRFMEKIAEWVPPEKRLLIKRVAEGIVETRSGLEGSPADGTGPWAWNTLAAAGSSRDGIRYRVPEAIQDLWSRSLCGGGEVIELKGVIEEHLKPVVVKFRGKTTDIHEYCASLWNYLFTDDGEYHHIHTFRGTGQAVPQEDIVALIEV